MRLSPRSTPPAPPGNRRGRQVPDAKAEPVVVQNTTDYCDDGVYYQQGPQGCVAVNAPAGATTVKI